MASARSPGEPLVCVSMQLEVHIAGAGLAPATGHAGMQPTLDGALYCKGQLRVQSKRHSATDPASKEAQGRYGSAAYA